MQRHRPGLRLGGRLGSRFASARLARLLMIGILWFASGCSTESRDTAVVAVVGPSQITADEFRLSYALGFPHLTRGPASPRENYLQRMIDEQLLALEGYRLALHESLDVRRKIESMRAELLVERIFQREVNDRVVISDSNVLEAIGQASVRFKLRYLPASTSEQAARIRQVALREGFEAAVNAVNSLSDVGDNAVSFESPYLAENQIDESLLSVVGGLEVGHWSEAVRFRGAFVILQVVDIRQEIVDGITDPEARARVEQVQFQREAKRLAREFVSATMAPLQLRVKSGVYNRLRRYLWDWLSVQPAPTSLLDALKSAEVEAADGIRVLLPEVLLTTVNEDWTVERFLREYPVDRYPLSVTNRAAFDNDLFDALGLTLRDRVFVTMAEEDGIDGESDFKDELARWRDKFVYRAMYEFITDSVTVSPTESLAYFGRHRDRYPVSASFEQVAAVVAADARSAKAASIVADLLKRLRKRYPVIIRPAVLEQVEVMDPRATSAPALTVLKGHTGRQAFPVVDSHW